MTLTHFFPICYLNSRFLSKTILLRVCALIITVDHPALCLSRENERAPPLLYLLCFDKLSSCVFPRMPISTLTSINPSPMAKPVHTAHLLETPTHLVQRNLACDIKRPIFFRGLRLWTMLLPAHSSSLWLADHTIQLDPEGTQLPFVPLSALEIGFQRSQFLLHWAARRVFSFHTNQLCP